MPIQAADDHRPSGRGRVMAAAAAAMADSGPANLRTGMNDLKSLTCHDAMLDALVAIHNDVQPEAVKKLAPVQAFCERYDSPVKNLLKRRVNPESFDILKVLGRGAFGEVQLVKHRGTSAIYALKKLSKCEMIKKKATAFFWEERNIMAFTESPWLVKLHFAYQDHQHLYMVMDFMAGGNLLHLLQSFDVFTEEWARFYVAEIVLAIDAVHEMGFAHRDIKPDNVLLDQQGHVKLADFGTCIKLEANGKVRSRVAVGTPDYISPEVLESQDSLKPYSKHCDWWSLGVMLYEFLFVDPPFFDDTLSATYSKIMAHQPDKLEFPDDIEASDDAKDLIRRLLSRKAERIGTQGGCEEIQKHPFFTTIEWDNIQAMAAPHEPEVSSEEDAVNFDDPEPRDEPEELFKVARKFEGNSLAFVGFTFSRPTPVDSMVSQGGLTSTPASARIREEMTSKSSSKRRAHRDSVLALRSSEFETQLLMDENEDLNKTIRRLKGELVGAKAEAEATSNLSPVVDRALNDRAELETSRVTEEERIELERLKAREKDMDLQLAALKGEVSKMMADSEAKAKCHAAEIHELKTAAAEADLALMKFKGLDEQLSEERSKGTKLSLEVTRIREQFEVSKTEKSQLQKKCDRAVKSRSAIEETNEEMAETVRRLERKVKHAEDQVKDMETDMDRLMKKNSELTVESSGLKSDMKSLEEDRVRLESKITRLTETVESPEARAASADGKAEVAAVQLADLRTEHAEVTAALEKRLEDERSAKLDAITKLDDVMASMAKTESEIATANTLLDEERGNNVDLANDLEKKTVQYEQLLLDITHVRAEREVLSVQHNAAVEQCKELQSQLEASSKELQMASADKEELGAKLDKSVPREQIAALVAEVHELHAQIKKLENQHATDIKLVEAANEHEEKMHAMSAEKLTQFRKEQLLSVEQIKADYEEQLQKLTRDLRVEKERYEALEEQRENDNKTLRAQLTASRKRMTMRRAPGKNASQADVANDLKKVEKRNKSLEQELNMLRKMLEDTEADANQRVDKIQNEFDGAKDEWEVTETALRRALDDMKKDLGRKAADVEKLNSSLDKAANRISVLHETFSPQSIPRSPQHALVDLATSFQGILFQPKRGNMKRGWEEWSAKVDMSGFSLVYGQENLQWDAGCVRRAEAVRPEEVIHAKKGDVPCIFRILLVKTTKRKDKSTDITEYAKVHDKLENEKFFFRGHFFERAALEKDEPCNICFKVCSSSGGKMFLGSKHNRPYSCRDCSMIVHQHHITNNERMKACSGVKVVDKTLLLKAPTPSERDRWLECFQSLIKSELDKVEQERRCIDAGATPDKADIVRSKSVGHASSAASRVRASSRPAVMGDAPGAAPSAAPAPSLEGKGPTRSHII
eukprot:CAMPEP_0206289884 /NCGR_PEP_ID=MMETSP0106_2-20121207/2340_1 /ASSEMBLY_ACC=CAM_ASM_000206 /TAXON_ID=81532 /ORGANISM="Acanthoeca-like sp., Strain 10tr" /LENGTH=1385 /DNA_ID=CAMNT_0053720439 /DNA_START=135 /DNA_END=4292 /DNA_ORIENTATION=+